MATRRVDPNSPYLTFEARASTRLFRVEPKFSFVPASANSRTTDSNQFFTRLTSLSSIQFQSRLTSGDPVVFKLLRDFFSRSEVHLVRRLALECRMGYMRIVLLDVERHEFLNVRDGVECVQVQPLMLQNAPPGFDQGIWKNRSRFVPGRVSRSRMRSRRPRLS